jgi:hypothetical protein
LSMASALSLLTDKQVETLKQRMNDMGKDKLIVSLENELINANMLGKHRIAERLEQSLEWALKHSSWVI